MRNQIGHSCVHLERLEDRWAPAVIVSVDATANLHAIDPRIYGVAFATTAQLNDLKSPSNRWGGNTTSAYNWQANADNRGSDWYFQSLPYSSATPGQQAADFIASTKSGQADPFITIPTGGWVAKLGPSRGRLASYSIAKYGQQTGNDWQWFPDAGNGILSNGNVVITNNNPNDANVAVDESFQAGWVNLLKSQIGGAASARHTYILDNEPSIWYETHRDTHPVGATMQEISDKLRTYSAAIKGADANGYVMGPEEFGWSGYFLSGKDLQYGGATGDWANVPDKKAHNGADYLPWVLQDLKSHDLASGAHTLDAFTLHIYPQGDLSGHNEFSDATDNTTQLLRNRSTRELWDPTYVDQSWISQAGPESGIVRLIPRMRQWVDANYFSGTDIGITEYNWGAEAHMNGATTQADIYGIFGREGLSLANRWTTPASTSPTYMAMKLFRNYDGLNHGFGDVSSLATVPNPDQVSTFVSRRSSDGALTVVVINKNLYSAGNQTTAVTVNLSHFANTGTAQFWQLAATNPADQTMATITQQANVPISGNSFTFASKNQSVNMFVIMPAAQPAPTVAATIGDGTIQRSRVGSVTLTFSELVSIGSGAITLTRTGPGGTIGSIPVTIDTSMSTGTQTIAKLTFGGAFVSGGSLIDGRYSLNLKGNLTLDTGGAGMTSDVNVNFHRLFGDADGSGNVDVTDFGLFRAAFGTGNNIFDFDNDGDVDANDFANFRQRFGVAI